ncbi:MAG: hypothetical protein LBJ24_00820 [Treponema sp.]|nr:hypothetical protein [Treponema sp.]
MKIFGITISRDHEEQKRLRRQALEDIETVELLIERGSWPSWNKKYTWKIEGESCFTVYGLSLFSALRLIAVRLRRNAANRLRRTVARPLRRRLPGPEKNTFHIQSNRK